MKYIVQDAYILMYSNKVSLCNTSSQAGCVNLASWIGLDKLDSIARLADKRFRSVRIENLRSGAKLVEKSPFTAAACLYCRLMQYSPLISPSWHGSE